MSTAARCRGVSLRVMPLDPVPGVSGSRPCHGWLTERRRPDGPGAADGNAGRRRRSPCPSRMAPVRPGAVAVAPLTRARRWSPGARVPAAADRGLRGSGVWRSRRAEVPGRSRFAVGGRCVLGWTTRGRLSVRARAWTAGIRGRLAAQTERPGAAVGRRLRRPGGWQVVKPAQSGCGPLSERQADGGGSPISTMTIAVVTECIKSQALQCRRPDRWRFADPFPGKGTLFPGLTRPHAGLRA